MPRGKITGKTRAMSEVMTTRKSKMFQPEAKNGQNQLPNMFTMSSAAKIPVYTYSSTLKKCAPLVPSSGRSSDPTIDEM